MSSIEKFVSPFIAQQFPGFYRDQGPNFVAFVRAYYEWMEQTGGVVEQTRSLLDFRDVDLTSDAFIEYFRKTYIQSMPQDVAADKRLLIKHILDLYKSKGSPRAVELLFRLAFNEDIELYVPGDYIFKPSDNTWRVPTYIEVTDSPGLRLLSGTMIRNAAGTATAVVEGLSIRAVGGKNVSVLEISSLRGSFKRGDRVYQTSGDAVTSSNPVTVVGSLTAVAISSGGQNFSAGDILDINGSGVGGKAKVKSVIDDFTGAVDFTIVDGGSGFTTNAVVTVAPTIVMSISGLDGFISVGDKVVDSTTSANGTVTFANSSQVRVIDFSTTLDFNTGDQLVGPYGTADIGRVIGGVGTGASFRVGSLTNREIITFNDTPVDSYLGVSLDRTSNTLLLQLSSKSGTFTSNDTVTSSANVAMLEGFTLTSNTIASGETLANSELAVSGLTVYRSDGSLVYCTGSEASLTNANLVSGVVLVSSVGSALFQLIRDPVKETIAGSGLVNVSNSTAITVSNVSGYFIKSSTVTDSNTAATATVDSVQRLTDWGFDGSAALADNLDSTIDASLPLTSLEVGTIASLSQVDPGVGYLTAPYINVNEPRISALNIFDSNLTLKGNNAVITSNITAGNGSITSVEVIDSGQGYLDNEELVLTSGSNPNVVRGNAIVFREGRGEGRWLNRRSFASDVMKLQDGFFYQNYSYEIVAQRMLSTYEKLVRDLVHPAGMALFGAFRMTDYVEDDVDVVEESATLQEVVTAINVGPYYNLYLDSLTNTFSIAVSYSTGTFGVGDTVTSSANVVQMQATVVTAAGPQVGETLANTSLGISGLYVYRSDGSQVYCTGSDSDLTNANLVANAVLVSDTTTSLIRLDYSPTKDTVYGEGTVDYSNSTHVGVSSSNGYFIRSAVLADANSGAAAVISDVVRLTDWNFQASTIPVNNLDAAIGSSIAV